MKLGACVALGYYLIMSSRYLSTKTRIVLAQAKEVPGKSQRIDAICNF